LAVEGITWRVLEDALFRLRSADDALGDYLFEGKGEDHWRKDGA
jgi:hypothetical protein